MAKDFTVRITNPQRAAEWQAVFGTTTVCVRSPFPHFGNLPGFSEPQLLYLLDLDEITPEQRLALVMHIAEKFSLPAEEVEAALDTDGVPLLAQDCTAVISNPQRWL